MGTLINVVGIVGGGLVGLLARLISPIMNDLALSNLSMVGSILIFCVGINIFFTPLAPTEKTVLAVFIMEY